MKSILPFFSPTEVIMIDDERLLLNAWKIKLRPLSINLKTFDSPFKALQHIKESTLKHDNSLNLNTIHHDIYSSDRFKQISTIIVDYDMPGMNGLEVCRQITAPHIQKIMLTGAATTDIAVAAFNEGIIHQFIQKNDPDVFVKLQNEYPEVSILQDPAFVQFFENITHENKLIEHYLLDPIGSFLFLSDSGNPSSLFVFNEETLESQEDLMPELDRHTDLAQEVYSKKQAICFYPFNTLEKYEPTNWKNHLQPLNRLESGSPVFYAFVPDLINFDQSKIISLKDYQAKLEK